MRQVCLTKGFVALVDDDDYDYVARYKWRVQRRKNHCYAIRHSYEGGKQRTRYMHREIMGVRDPKIEVDHVNHDGLDNQKSNLRACTRAQNRQNARKPLGATKEHFGEFACLNFPPEGY